MQSKEFPNMETKLEEIVRRAENTRPILKPKVKTPYMEMREMAHL